tara:strand:- start:1872 stop:2471 length:600 start_codon:yes stop_codon:yes gene_type:complete
MNVIDFIQGFIIGGSLIVAIGPQNLFVINQGLRKNFILATVLFCSLSDSLLIFIGINLSNYIINLNTNIIYILKIIGGIWIFLYGLIKIKNIRNIKEFSDNKGSEKKLIKTLSILFFITYANPHVYLDTIILIGSISANFDNKLFFGMGAISASFVFFFLLGYLSKFLSKYIHSKKIWIYIDSIIGTLMILYGIYFIFF